jgi:hypothetical protein
MSRPVLNAPCTGSSSCLRWRAGRSARIASCLLLLTSALASASVPSPVHADGVRATSDPTGGVAYAVTRWTIDGGGGRSSGDTYTISGTIAQPDAEPLQPSTGASYAITGGFWPGAAQLAPPGEALFEDGFEPD